MKAVLMALLLAQAGSGTNEAVIDYARYEGHEAAPVAAVAPAQNPTTAPAARADIWPLAAPAVKTPQAPVRPTAPRAAASTPAATGKSAAASASAAARRVSEILSVPRELTRSMAPIAPPAASSPKTPATAATKPAASTPAKPAASGTLAMNLAPREMTPEAIKPTAFDPEAQEALPGQAPPAEAVTAAAATALAAAPADFQPRREDLGKPRNIVPTVRELPVAPPQAAPHSGGSWYKLLAGALFLMSLGLIGYRHRHRRQTTEQPSPASWLPPRSPAMNRRRPSLRRDFGEEEAFILGENAAGLLTRSARAAAPAAAEGEDLPFHEEIEKRIRRFEADQKDRTRPAPAGNRARKVNDDDYRRIMDLAASGRSARDIAEELGLPPRAVHSLLRLRPAVDSPAAQTMVDEERRH